MDAFAAFVVAMISIACVRMIDATAAGNLHSCGLLVPSLASCDRTPRPTSATAGARQPASRPVPCGSPACPRNTRRIRPHDHILSVGHGLLLCLRRHRYRPSPALRSASMASSIARVRRSPVLRLAAVAANRKQQRPHFRALAAMWAGLTHDLRRAVAGAPRRCGLGEHLTRHSDHPATDSTADTRLAGDRSAMARAFTARAAVLTRATRRW